MKNNKHALRIPRPMGTTQIMSEYHKSGEEGLLNKVKKFLIQQWLLSNGVLCGKSYNVMELSNFLLCNPDEIRLQMRDNMLSTKLWDRDKQEELINSLMGQQIAWALEDRMEVENQVRILRQSQGNRYTPFVTSELNKAISMKMQSTNSLQAVIRGMAGGGSVNIFNQFNQQNNMMERGVTVEDAIAIVQEENAKLAPGKEVQYIEAHYEVEEFPEVVATKQEGVDTSKEGINFNRGQLEAIADDYKGALKSFDEDHHEIRREIELGVDRESEDPEITIYPG